MLSTQQVTQLVDVLDSLGYIRKKKVTGDWYTIYCPFHKDGKERKPSCGVLLRSQVKAGSVLEPGLFHCFTCHHSQPVIPSLLEILRNNNVEEDVESWLISHIDGYEPDSYDSQDDLVPNNVMSLATNKFAIDYISSRLGKTKQQFIREEELEQYRFTVPYMYERGLTDRIIDRYDIGFDPNHIPENKTKPVPCVTFPVRDREGRCIFIFRRSVEGRYFNYPTGVEKPLYGIYELKPDTRTVVICESAFNMMTCVRHGFEAVALFGTGNSLQLRQLKSLGVQRFIIALDPDEAGMRGTEKLKRALKGTAFISQVQGIPFGKDLNDLTDEEFNSLTFE